jgi:hypothetical protein
MVRLCISNRCRNSGDIASIVVCTMTYAHLSMDVRRSHVADDSPIVTTRHGEPPIIIIVVVVVIFSCSIRVCFVW